MNAPPTVDHLQAEFGLTGIVHFEPGEGGLICARVRTRHAQAVIYLHGAHVTRFVTGGRDLLFLSEKSHYQADTPIRGGVPICFPWFGPHATDSSAPMHGLARTRQFAVESVAARDDDVEITLRLRPGQPIGDAWPLGVTLRHRIVIGSSLEMNLEVENASGAPFGFEEALHTYFAVNDIHRVEVSGLDNTEYLDKTDGMNRKKQVGPVRFTGETDRVYLATPATTTIHDGECDIEIATDHADATVVWNPWIAKAAAMPDFGDDEWQRMVCVETANCGRHAVNLPDGMTHTMTARLSLK